MQVAFSFLGCRLNEAEIEQWARQFQLEGAQVVESVEEADLIVLNSCAVTKEAVRKSRKFIRQLRRRNPEAKLVVSGCYVTLHPEEVARSLGVDLVVVNAEKETLVQKALTLLGERPKSEYPKKLRRLRSRAFIKVQDGCRHRCTFCIVTVARGEERSRPIEEILSEIRQLEAEGVKEIVLTGVHLGGYGGDLGSSLTKLLEAILEKTEIPRIRCGSLEPWELDESFFRLFQDCRLMPHLHLPMQSGSDRILKKMARRNRMADFERIIGMAREVREDFHFTTDIIVGFPGETDGDFQKTCEAAERIGFAHLHLFPYSPREGTPAARFPHQVSPTIKARRMAVLQEINRRLRQKALAASIGRKIEVLWERLEGGKLLGYTPHYLPIEMMAEEGAGRQVGGIQEVVITGVCSDRLIARLR